MAAVVSMASDMHRDSAFANIPFRVQRVLTLLRECLDDDRYCCLVAEDGDRLIGAMVGVMGMHFFSDVMYAADLAVYVVPEKRGSSAAVRLVQAFERWAKTAGCAEIRCGVTTGLDPDLAWRFYTGLGFSWAGQLFVKPISPLRQVNGQTIVAA